MTGRGRQLSLRITEGDRLLPEMLARIEVDWDTGCWRWIGTVDNWGYGRMGTNAGRGIHRHMYRETVGPIPDGMDVDHVCHNIDLDCAGGKTCLHRRCVNPDHLEPVTRAVNMSRSNRLVRRGDSPTHCKLGHERNEANTYVPPRGRPQCKECNRVAVRAYLERKRAA